MLRANSGRYRYREEERYQTPRRRLRELKAASYDTFLKEEAPKGCVVVVCCLASWLPQSRRTRTRTRTRTLTLTRTRTRTLTLTRTRTRTLT